MIFPARNHHLSWIFHGYVSHNQRAECFNDPITAHLCSVMNGEVRLWNFALPDTENISPCSAMVKKRTCQVKKERAGKEWKIETIRQCYCKKPQGFSKLKSTYCLICRAFWCAQPMEQLYPARRSLPVYAPCCHHWKVLDANTTNDMHSCNLKGWYVAM